MKLIQHIEKYIGTIEGGISTSHEIYGNLSFSYIYNQPFDNIITYLSLGISNHELSIDNNKIRIELLMSTYNIYSKSEISECLFDISSKILNIHSAPSRGSVIESSFFIEKYNIYGFYCTFPVFFEEEFWVLKNDNFDIFFIWLIPLFKEEIEFIELNGWSKFEDLLEIADCDFWNLTRDKVCGHVS